MARKCSLWTMPGLACKKITIEISRKREVSFIERFAQFDTQLTIIICDYEYAVIFSSLRAQGGLEDGLARPVSIV